MKNHYRRRDRFGLVCKMCKAKGPLGDGYNRARIDADLEGWRFVGYEVSRKGWVDWWLCPACKGATIGFVPYKKDIVGV